MIEYPNLTRLLWHDTVISGAIHREWIVNLGRRTAYQRIAHVLCELVTRLQAIGARNRRRLRPAAHAGRVG